MFMLRALLHPILLFNEGTGGGAAAQQQAAGDAGTGDGGQAGQGNGQGGDAGAQQGDQGAAAGAGQQQGQGAHEETVPYDRFKQTNERAVAAEAERDRLQAEITRREREALPELERVRAEAEDAKTRATAAEQRVTLAEEKATNLERSAWVRQAAQNADFHDSEDAVLRIDLKTVETEQGAVRAVQELAARDELAHLIRKPETKTGSDLLQQVLQGKTGNGQGNGDDKKVIPASELEAMNADQLVVLQEKDPDLYERSLRAATQAGS